MAARPRWHVLLSLAVVAVLVIGIAALVAGDDDSDSKPLAQSLLRGLSGERDDRGDEPGEMGDQPGALSESTKPGAATRRPPVKDKPAPPSQPDGSAWQEYLKGTREVVERNEGDLRAAVDLITQALVDRDAGALEALFAPDEGDQAAYADELAGAYPQILTTSPASTVNVFTSGEATVYIAYTQVTWEDGGQTSQHTIPIVLRFVDGEWRLTTFGEAGADLQFAQTVVL